jgi:MFS family permease
LLAIDTLDELSTGMPSLAAPAMRSEFGLSYGDLSLLVLTVPLAMSLVCEPPLLLWAAGRNRTPVIVSALVMQALALGCVAVASGPVSALCCVSATTLATSVACAVAQTALVEQHPDRTEQILVRWTLTVGVARDARARQAAID